MEFELTSDQLPVGLIAELAEQIAGSWVRFPVKRGFFKRISSLQLELLLKDGAYYRYCAYVLRISRYSDFLSVMLINTGIFLRGLKLSGESTS